MTIEEAEKVLEELQGDNESYHSNFDRIIEERLEELDPKFMKELNKIYEKHDVTFWYA